VTTVHFHQMTFRPSNPVLISKEVSIVFILQVHLDVDQVFKHSLREHKEVHHLSTHSSLLVHDRISLVFASL